MDSSEAADGLRHGQGRFVENSCAPQPGTCTLHDSTASNPSCGGIADDRNASLHAVAVGSCYARSATYPTGVYWVASFFLLSGSQKS